MFPLWLWQKKSPKMPLTKPELCSCGACENISSVAASCQSDNSAWGRDARLLLNELTEKQCLKCANETYAYWNFYRRLMCVQHSQLALLSFVANMFVKESLNLDRIKNKHRPKLLSRKTDSLQQRHFISCTQITFFTQDKKCQCVACF